MPRDEASDSGLKPAVRGSIRGCGRLFGNLVSKSESCGVQNKAKTNEEQNENKTETDEEQTKNKTETKAEQNRKEKESEREVEKEKEREIEVERENDSSPPKAPFRSDGDELQIQAFICFFSL